MRLLPETSNAHLVRRVPILADRAAEIASRANLERVLELNGRERGATVFIIGSGPQLNDLTDTQRRTFRLRPTIGVNRTQYAVDLTYFLSAYPAEIMLARARCRSGATIIHLRPRIEPPLVRNTLTMRRIRHKQGEPLESSLSGPIPTLHTFKNVALAATHFALVLGAARVVFAGVEQTSALHFYDVHPTLRSEMSADIQRIRAKSLFSADHPYASAQHLIDRLATPPEVLASADFFTDSHQQSFRDFFEELRRHGTAVYATTPNSVVAAAGAGVVELEEAFTW